MDFFEVKKFAIMGVFDGLSGTCMAWVAQAVVGWLVGWLSYPKHPRKPKRRSTEKGHLSSSPIIFKGTCLFLGHCNTSHWSSLLRLLSAKG